jgi:hypothetical protein
MNTREQRRLDVDFSKYPAYSRMEDLVNRLPEEWYRALLEQEQAEADRFSRADRRAWRAGRRRS